ncbi:hypothetical protein POVCU1_033010 [Plasmodium ovale curtisi]|uniref:Uncharacterized protein n=1 Tax=Plasmodium ovale curtisi TaxID=864141 RepID=A0A1A8WUC4_PLAOA|nr:hypothetical protein POVCU1_033010 [Plasmodium ovale curtisi]
MKNARADAWVKEEILSPTQHSSPLNWTSICLRINTSSPHLKNTAIALTAQFVSWERLLPPLPNVTGVLAPP